MESQLPFASRDEIWRLQESLNELSTAQAHHNERIMRLEKRRDDDTRVKSVWGPGSPFPGALGGPAMQGEHESIVRHQIGLIFSRRFDLESGR